MLTREEFIKTIEEYKELYGLEEQISKLFNTLDKDFGSFGLARHTSLILKLLEVIMKDTKTKWIEYWIYELNFGRDAKKDSVSFGKKKFPIKTVDDLYNILTKK